MLTATPRAHTRFRDTSPRPRAGLGDNPVIPYDAAAAFRITGRPGNLLQDVINISADGVFVAVAVGYGFEEDRERPLVSASVLRAKTAGGQSIVAGDLTLAQIPVGALVEGLRVNPRFASWAPGAAGVQGDGDATDLTFGPDDLPEDRVFGNVLQRIKAPEEIAFLFSLIDSGTGREFQDQPSHNLASLGKSNGERPFRLFAQPFHFAPRTALRVQITERTEGIRGTLFVVLYGYRVLGTTACPEPVVRHLRGSPLCPVETIGNPDAPIIPFDYVSRVTLTGRRGNLVDVELPISAEVGFVATHIGYGIATESRNVPIQLGAIAGIQDAILAAELRSWAPGTKVNLGHLPLRLIPGDALLDGIRIRPGWIRIALEDNGQLATALPFDLLDTLFERINRPEDVSFRYALFDTGTGREMQNRRLHNVAGLGIADGNRPFKRLARPMIVLPRASLRIEIEEVFGRGEVFFAFHGYKMLAQQRGTA